MMAEGFVFDDGGRREAGYRGKAGDCVCRAVAIAAQLPYHQVYSALAEGNSTQRKTKKTRSTARSARNGIYTNRKWFKDYMASLGAVWTSTMQIGSGCKVHLCADELPDGRIVARVSGHMTAVIYGVIHDTYDPRREAHYVQPNNRPLRESEWLNENGICGVSRRCVYGYWTFPEAMPPFPPC